ncbi:MFS transporter [Sanguibacter sp. Z1732]
MRRLLYVAVCSGVASSVLFLYQVPAMVSAGLVLGLASALAGLRGLFQLLGRLPLPWLVNRYGARQVFQVGLALVGVSSLLLLVSGNVVVAVAFAVVAGASVGASSTLESIYSAQVVQVRLIGLFLGLYSMIWGLGSAVGPVIAGFVTEATGTRLPVFVGIAIIGVLGALFIPRDPGRTDP